MYMLYCFGGVQNKTFINLTGWFIVIGLSWWFPKWKRPMMVIYGLEIFLVCFRHSKSVWHLLAHFAFCVVFYVAAESVRKKIGKEAVERAGEALRGSVEKTIENDIKDALREDLRANMKRLELTEGERAVVSQLSEGKMIKEVEGVSKNTKTDYIESAMLRNGCRTKAELIAIYSLEERLPDAIPRKLECNPVSLRDFLFIFFYVKFDKVKLINSYFRFADKSKIDELKKRCFLYYVQGKDCGFIADSLCVCPGVITKELHAMREKMVRVI